MKEIILELQHGSIAALTNFDIKSVNHSKPTLVLLHGWQDNAATFSDLCKRLTSDYNLLAFDWPGHGLSAHRGDDNYYHFFDYIDDLHQILSLLAHLPVNIIGHSLGAIVGGCYAAAFPENVDKVILIEGLSPLVESPKLATQRLRTGIVSRQHYRQRQQQRNQRSMASFADALQLRANVNHLPTSVLEPVVRRGTKECNGRWYWRHDHRLRCDSLYRMAQQHADTLLASIQSPVLSILGEQGYAFIRQANMTSLAMNDFKQVMVHGGHHCHLQSPKCVYQHILAFIPPLSD